nr:MAG TPA: hypothetical protein [Caudoviricetes sp.]
MILYIKYFILIRYYNSEDLWNDLHRIIFLI